MDQKEIETKVFCVFFHEQESKKLYGVQYWGLSNLTQFWGFLNKRQSKLSLSHFFSYI